jgi:REP element-mobilizing transposase RayT
MFPAKYRRVAFYVEVTDAMKEVCHDIEKEYEVNFLKIRTDKDHVHFLGQ